MKNESSHPLAGQTVEIRHGLYAKEKFKVEDYWDRVFGKSWMHANGNPACLIYAMRSAEEGLPTDDNVLYGKIGHRGVLVHESEFA